MLSFAPNRRRSLTRPRPHLGAHLPALSRIVRAIGRHLRAIGPVRAALRVVVIGFVAAVISGIGHAVAHPARNEPNEAGRFVSSLTHDNATFDGVPAGFDSTMGYEPQSIDGILINPQGGCSTPGGIGPESFETACQTHDLGYDVLRLAEADGDRLGAWARAELDLVLYADLLETCETARCRAAATAYYGVVTANSIRQGYKAPEKEPGLPWMAMGLAIVGMALIPPAGFFGWRRWSAAGRRSESALAVQERL